MAHWISSRISSGSGGFLNSIVTYMHMRNAALRIESAVEGRFKPSEDDLRTLGIDHTPAYGAVVRD